MGQAQPEHASIPDNQEPAQMHFSITVHAPKAASVTAAALGRCTTEARPAGCATAASWVLRCCWGLTPHKLTGNAAVQVASDS